MFYRLDLKSLGNVLQTNKSTSLRDFPLSNIKPFCLKSLSILMVDSMGFPCGLVYIALSGALVYNSPDQSLIYMAIFGLGTCPVMIGYYLFPKLNLG